MKILTLLSIVLQVLLTGCGNSTGNLPPKIISGRDICDNCFMIINESKYAAAITLQNGEEKRFDDIGCMLSYMRDNKDLIKNYWVNDFITGKSIPAEKAFLVKSKKEVTPMGGGIIAFSLREKAENFAADENSAVLNFIDLTKGNK